MRTEAKQTYLSSCPNCGRTLFRGTPNSQIELGCPKCNEYLKVTFQDTGYQVCVIRQEKELHTIT